MGKLFPERAAKAVKLKSGKDLIKLFSVPRKPTKANPAPYWEPADRPEEWAAFGEYCRVDVDAMRRLYRAMPHWNYRPGQGLEDWQLDQAVNGRGLPVDLAAVRAVMATVEQATARLNAELAALTQGAVTAATQREALLEWLQARGAKMTAIHKAAVLDALADPTLPKACRRALQIRQQVGRTSTAKYLAILDREVEGRVHGVYRWRGAERTGRWTSSGVQMHNLPRGDGFDQEAGAEAFLAGVADLAYDDVMGAAANCVRPMITAPESKKFVVADFSNIEGRVLAWVAGEVWKIQAFRDFDAGHGHDLYKLIHTQVFGGLPEDVSKSMRQEGKVVDLASGYAGGVGAFDTFAVAFRVDLEAIYRVVWPRATEGQQVRAQKALKWFRAQHELKHLSDHAILGADIAKQVYRLRHPATVAFWADLEDAFGDAIRRPGVVFEAGRLRLMRVTNPIDVLVVQLPSGRRLCYHQPALRIRTKTYRDPETGERRAKEEETLTFWGPATSEKGGRMPWVECTTYSGRLTENVVQAISADFMAHALRQAEDACFNPVGHTHDEVICECDDVPYWSVDALCRTITVAPPWAKSMPLAAAGFETHRYRKD